MLASKHPPDNRRVVLEDWQSGKPGLGNSLLVQQKPLGGTACHCCWLPSTRQPHFSTCISNRLDTHTHTVPVPSRTKTVSTVGSSVETSRNWHARWGKQHDGVSSMTGLAHLAGVYAPVDVRFAQKFQQCSVRAADFVYWSGFKHTRLLLPSN